MNKQLAQLARDLQVLSVERTFKTQEFSTRDQYFTGLVASLLSSGVVTSTDLPEGVDLDPDTVDRVRNLMNEHHRGYMSHMTAIIADIERMTEKVRAELGRRKEEDGG